MITPLNPVCIPASPFYVPLQVQREEFMSGQKHTRNTVAKTEIYNLLQQSEVALSHAEIQQSLDGLCDRVTIYRVLERLLEEGSVHKVINVDAVVKYAYCHHCSQQHVHHHIHFSCEQCKSVICLEGVQPSYKLPAKYIVKDANFMITGICPECS